MERWTRLGGIIGATGVIAGAFGAHALKERLTPELMAVFQTGVLYHLIHAVAIIAALSLPLPARRRASVVGSFACGVLVFSGSLYALALTGIRVLGAVTPLGGLAFIVGWSLLAWPYRKETDSVTAPL